MRHLIITLITAALYIQGYPQTNENMSRITGEFYKDSELYYKVESHGKIFEISDFFNRRCEPARKIIADSDLKLLPYEKFREKMLELFNVDMDTTYFYYPDEYTMPWLCIIHDGYIDYKSNNFINLLGREAPELHIWINKLILYDDIHAFNWFKKYKPNVIFDLVKYAGIVSNDRWLEFAIKEDLFYFDDLLSDYIFGKKYHSFPEPGREGRPKERYYLRKEMLDSLISKEANMSMISIILEDIEEDDDFERWYFGNQDDMVGYLYRKICEDLWQYGYIEYRIDRDPSLLEYYRKKNYWGSPSLKYFCENFKPLEERLIEGTWSQLEPFPEDNIDVAITDGEEFTDVHSGKDFNYPVIFRIPYGAKIKVLEFGKWKKIEYEGKTGYVWAKNIKYYRSDWTPDWTPEKTLNELK